MFEELPTNLAAVRERMAAACDRAGRDPAEVTLVAVTKSHPVDAMHAAVAAGLLELGESRVQEALPKLEVVDRRAHVHLIGRLQSNKVNKAVGRFTSIMTVDRPELLERIARRAEEIGVVQPVWIQVNASGEEQKGGCPPSEVGELWRRALDGSVLEPWGLMTMARYEAPAAELRATFATLRRGAENLVPPPGRTVLLSMGMSDDYEIAIEEGATHVRLGTVLFGAREPHLG